MKDAVFTMKLEADLRAAFLAEAEASHRPASQVVREFMRSFVHQQQAQREHEAFLQRKIEVARASVAEGLGRSNEEVEAAFAARRASSVLDALARRAPQKAHKKVPGSLVELSIEEVAVGDELVVLPHELCPVDGVVVDLVAACAAAVPTSPNSSIPSSSS